MSPIKRFWIRQRKVHRYFKISGGYRFMRKSLLRLLAFLIGFLIITWALDTYVFNFNDVAESLTERYSPATVVLWFFISEMALSILAPEAFIIWAQSLTQPWAMVLVLSIVSYTAGIITYLIGSRLHKLPKVHKWVDIKFAVQKRQIRQYGGLLIGFGALTPLPFGIINLMCGLVEVKFRLFAIALLMRFVRIFGAMAIIVFFGRI